MIHTFYSYKGGVGRSMALANVAEWLYRQGRRVIMIDWDLEAPGLEGYFYPPEQMEDIRAKPGLIDLLQHYKTKYERYHTEVAGIQDQLGSIAAELGKTLWEKRFDRSKILQLLQPYATLRKDDIGDMARMMCNHDGEVSISAIADILLQYFRMEEPDEFLIEKMALPIHDKLFQDPSDQLSVRLHLLLYTLLDQPAIDNLTTQISNPELTRPAFDQLLQTTLKAGLPNLDASLTEDLKGYLHEIYPPKTKERQTAGLWLMSAGSRAGADFVSYSKSVQNFSWSEFYRSFDGERYFEQMRSQLETLADIVLIDSRTGVSEMSGASTRQLADTIVVITAPNYQNLSGANTMIRSFLQKEVLEARGMRPLRIVAVPSRIDTNELALRNQFEATFYRTFAEVVPPEKSRDFWQLGIPYVPRYVYIDEIAIGTSTDPSILESSAKSAELDKAFSTLGSYLLNDRIETVSAQTPPVGISTASPFVGLKAFTTDDTDLFFGWSLETERLMKCFEQSRLIILSGPAGSGKTSLIQAGLIPRLQHEYPEAEIISQRCSAITERLPLPASTATRNILILDEVDILLARNNRQQLSDISAQIQNWLTAYPSNTVLLSVRSEYLRALQEFVSLGQSTSVSLGEINDAELIRIMTEPARRQQLKFEPGLIDRIIRDSAAVYPRLPIIQYVLSQLWQNRQLNVLTNAAYEKMGQIDGIARQIISNSLHAIPNDQLTPLRHILTRLVDSRHMIRVPLSLQDISKEDLGRLKPLIDARLIITNIDKDTQQQTISLSHDSLLTSWKTLTDWINEDKNFLSWREYLQDALENWEIHNRDNEYLLDSAETDWAVDFLNKRLQDLTEREHTFITLSKQNADSERAKMRNRSQFRKIFIIAAGAAACIAVAAAVFYLSANGFKKEFSQRLAAIKELSGMERQKAICRLSGYPTTGGDSDIEKQKDSLLDLCIQYSIQIGKNQYILDSVNNKLDALSKSISHSAASINNAARIDTLELSLNHLSILLHSTDNTLSRDTLRQDSARKIHAIDSIFRSDHLLDSAIKIGSRAQQIMLDQSATTVVNPTAVFEQSAWFKKGYYLSFENINIKCTAITKTSQTITVECYDINTPEGQNFSKPFKTGTISADQSLSFDYGTFNYIIVLNRIGSAGYNPFTSGAYITFSKFKK